MKYMLLLYSTPEARPEPGSPRQAAEMNEWFAFSNALVESGAMVAGDPLHDVDSATTLRVRDGAVQTTDGPFAETKETLGGYYIVDVENIDQALEWAQKVPLVPYGSVEVRPLMELPPA